MFSFALPDAIVLSKANATMSERIAGSVLPPASSALETMPQSNQSLPVPPADAPTSTSASASRITMIPPKIIINTTVMGRPKAFFCNNDWGTYVKLMDDVLGPDYDMVDLSSMEPSRRPGRHWHSIMIGYPSYEHDVFLGIANNLMCSFNVASWLATRFVGKLVFFDGEQIEFSQEAMQTFPAAFRPQEHAKYVPRQYLLGPVPTDWKPNIAMQLSYMQIIWWGDFYEKGSVEPFLQHPARNFTDYESRNLLIYAHSNCAESRERAFDELANMAGPVEYGGKCRGSSINPNKVHVNTPGSTGKWMYNLDLFRKYKFCLTMEHDHADGYVTEKVLLAFQAGCIPIFHGPDAILEIFNENAFIFYNTSDPAPALAKFQLWATNQTLYNEALMAPVLAPGAIETFFSFNASVGGGALRNRIRDFLGVNDYEFVL
jgi:hypothetical protein